MLHVVLAALAGARLADFRAKGACLCRELRSARHETRSHRTNRRASAVQLDATRHHFDVGFVQTGRGTMLTCGHAGSTFVDAILIFLVCHLYDPLW